MRTTWTAGLNKQQSEELKKDFGQSVFLRKRLTDMLESRIKSAREKSISPDMYSSPSWAHIQADNVGYERGLREIINLLDSESLKDIK